MLDIQTFDARKGGNVLYKALAHPLAAEALSRLARDLTEPFGVFDPDGVGNALFALHPDMPRPAEYYVQDVQWLDRSLAGQPARPLTDLPHARIATLLIAGFETKRLTPRIAAMLPHGTRLLTLDDARLPANMLTNPRQYLDRLNFATNFAFFRDRDNLHTRLVSANYWAGYGAGEITLWLRLFDETGAVLATWQETLPANAGGFTIESTAVRARFNLPDFAGQLFMHAIGVAGHDVVKYAVDIYGTGDEKSLSVTHDANAWPSDRYAGLPAPDTGETVLLWVQNSHAAPIPAGTIELDRMGAERPASLKREIPPYASVALNVADLLPGLNWPAQIEMRAGRHVVRPRYEITRDGRTRIAHINVERADLKPDPGLKTLSNLLGRGFLLPFPVLPPDRYRSSVQPNPMAESQTNLPIRIDVFDTEGRLAGQKFLGRLPRDHSLAVDLADIGAPEGHAELVYDFREGGDADGWLHGLFRYQHRISGHAADTSFGAHIFNTAMIYRDEPQSYSGPPPGLTTRLFLKLGDAWRRSFAVLIYPASAAWHPVSATQLQLLDGAGEVIAEHDMAIACSGSATIFPHEIFGEAMLGRAGPGGYVLVRDTTCRLFGYHGLATAEGGFSLDHMFGF
jgi:hypothetical protein